MTEKFPPTVRGTIVANRLMSDLSWLRVGGVADYLYQPADKDDLSNFLRKIQSWRLSLKHSTHHIRT